MTYFRIAVGWTVFCVAMLPLLVAITSFAVCLGLGWIAAWILPEED